MGGEIGDRAGGAEVTERIGGTIGIAPEPVKLIVIDGRVGGILAEDLAIEKRLFERGFLSGENGIAVDPFAGDAIEALGDVEAFDFDARLSTRFNIEGFAADAEAIFGEFVAVTCDGEEDALVHQAGLVKGDDAGAIGDVADVVDGGEFDERDASVGLVIDDGDDKWASGLDELPLFRPKRKRTVRVTPARGPGILLVRELSICFSRSFGYREKLYQIEVQRNITRHAAVAIDGDLIDRSGGDCEGDLAGGGAARRAVIV